MKKAGLFVLVAVVFGPLVGATRPRASSASSAGSLKKSVHVPAQPQPEARQERSASSDSTGSVRSTRTESFVSALGEPMGIFEGEADGRSRAASDASTSSVGSASSLNSTQKRALGVLSSLAAYIERSASVGSLDGVGRRRSPSLDAAAWTAESVDRAMQAPRRPGDLPLAWHFQPEARAAGDAGLPPAPAATAHVQERPTGTNPTAASMLPAPPPPTFPPVVRRPGGGRDRLLAEAKGLLREVPGKGFAEAQAFDREQFRILKEGSDELDTFVEPAPVGHTAGVVTAPVKASTKPNESSTALIVRSKGSSGKLATLKRGLAGAVRRLGTLLSAKAELSALEQKKSLTPAQQNRLGELRAKKLTGGVPQRLKREDFEQQVERYTQLIKRLGELDAKTTNAEITERMLLEKEVRRRLKPSTLLKLVKALPADAGNALPPVVVAVCMALPATLRGASTKTKQTIAERLLIYLQSQDSLWRRLHDRSALQTEPLSSLQAMRDGLEALYGGAHAQLSNITDAVRWVAYAKEKNIDAPPLKNARLALPVRVQ